MKSVMSCKLSYLPLAIHILLFASVVLFESSRSQSRNLSTMLVSRVFALIPPRRSHDQALSLYILHTMKSD